MSGLYHGREKWIEPHDYGKRSFSLDGGILPPKGKSVADAKDYDFVTQGLQLVGKGLHKQNSLNTKEFPYSGSGKNFSTTDIQFYGESSNRARGDHLDALDKQLSSSFNPGVMPAEEIIEYHFNRVLASNKFFWGNMPKGWQNMAPARKWQFVCRERISTESEKKGAKANSVRDQDHQTFNFIKCKLQSSKKASHALHELERLLRRKSFSMFFLAQQGVEFLSEICGSVDSEDFYVFLTCIKTLMNYEEGRLRTLKSGPLMQLLCSMLTRSNINVKAALLCGEILLVLTYNDIDGKNAVVAQLDSEYCEWFSSIDKILTTPVEQLGFEKHVIITKPQQILRNYCTTCLFLINSIVQASASAQERYRLLKRFKEHEIHKIFSKMKQLDCGLINDEIAKYRGCEHECALQVNEEKMVCPDIPYADSLSTLIAETRNTALEYSVGQVIRVMSELVLTRTFSDSFKLFTLFHSILDYLKESNYGDETNDSNAVFRMSLTHIMDNLQSDEIARRAMNDLNVCHKKIELLEKQLKSKHQGIGPSAEKLVEETVQLRENLRKKEVELKIQGERLDVLTKQRRIEKKSYEQAFAHNIAKEPKRANSFTLFSMLKNKSPNQDTDQRLKRHHSLSRSARTTSLVNTINSEPEDEKYREAGQENVHDMRLVHAKKTSVGEGVLHTLGISPFGYPPEEALLTVIGGKETLNSDSSLKSESVKDPKKIDPTRAPPPPPLPPNLKNARAQPKDPLPKSDIFPRISAPPPPPPLPRMAQDNPLLDTSGKRPVVRKLKQIHWDKIDNVSDTIWNQSRDKSQLVARRLQESGVFDEINDLFKLNDGKVSKTLSRKAKEKTVNNLLPRDLAHQFGINLHMYSGLSVEGFVLKVLCCDHDIIKNQSLMEFFSKDDLINIPTNVKKVFQPYQAGQARAGESEGLERFDRIFLELCINLEPYWSARSQCLLTLTTYERDYYDLIYKLQKIDDAVTLIRNSNSFRQALHVIVEIGNHMNYKQASGIRLGSLPKLAYVKTNKDSNVSFLHVIERILRTKCEGTYDFIAELSKVSDLKNLLVVQVEAGCQEYLERLNRVHACMSEGVLSKPEIFHPEDRFLEVAKPKAAIARRKATLLRDQSILTKRDFDHVMKLYGEDPGDSESRNSFFGHFIEFLTMLKKAARENIEEEEISRLYEQRKRLLDERQASAEDVTAKPNDTKEEEDTVDVLLKKLRKVGEDSLESGRNRRNSRQNNRQESEIENLMDKKDNDKLLSRTQSMLTTTQKI
ncbi:LAMI_0B00298g1_1 [Lachancea mirantina]|uniref:LAMI_0B00298g1_1 n=1 Tax=Lachancea mirantina TaxID=1230905 RepID=A0A1G4ITD9_9SACH|nr:LAMI_0B00298g1_1 [Lachancea mirantina]